MLLLLLAATAGATAAWQWTYRAAQAQYELYSGTLGEPAAPTGQDAKVAFEVSGPAARRLFEAMGPDKKDACSSDSGDRVRSKDDDRLLCTRFASGRYACQFGFDLQTGRSVGGSIC